jgi:hypothetical protein
MIGQRIDGTFKILNIVLDGNTTFGDYTLSDSENLKYYNLNSLKP